MFSSGPEILYLEANKEGAVVASQIQKKRECGNRQR